MKHENNKLGCYDPLFSCLLKDKSLMVRQRNVFLWGPKKLFLSTLNYRQLFQVVVMMQSRKTCVTIFLIMECY